ncbi:MAG TPA: glycosyltransferase family 4 protein [Bryobacteraceae bacterium]|jgi:glycosyltransferase involved in cell wall biosynthesis
MPRRILYVHASFVPPPTQLDTDRFYLLSETLEGDVLQPVWFRKPEEVEALFGPGSYPVYTSGRFRYHWFLSWRYSGVRQRLATFWFYLRKGLELHRERRYECIVAYSHMTTGLCAGLLKLLTGARLIIEIVTAPQLVYLTDGPDPSWKDRLMHLYSDACLQLSMLAADRAHFLFPRQLSAYPSLQKAKNSVFHEFVPISIIQRHPEETSELYVLLIGAPWYLKGADLLIEAFLRLAPDFPQVKLKILGYFPEQDKLHELIGGAPQIEVLKAIAHIEALQVICNAAIMVLPSRCEGLPRVLIEGMAAGLPLVGSDVAGIPALIHDGENGFVVPGGNPQMLEARLRALLADPQMRKRMGDASYERAHRELNEKVYVQQFTRMVDAALKGGE